MPLPWPKRKLALILAGLAVIVVAALGSSGSHESGETQLLLSEDGAALILTKLPARALKHFEELSSTQSQSALYQFFPSQLDADDLPPMAGRYVREGDRIRFEPRYGLVAGTSYRAHLALDRLPGDNLGARDLEVAVPPRQGSAPQVVAVFPSAPTLPENLLRFYIQFDRPMRSWDYLDHLALFDETTGTEMSDALHELDQGLWNPSSTRLTLWLEPGRIKRGLRNNIELGPPLTSGHRYRLEVRAGWPDASGRVTQEPLIYQFEAGAADRVSPRVDDWQLTPPDEASLAPLDIAFGEPLDHALVARSLSVRSGSRGVPGHWQAGLRATSSHFYPDEPWGAGTYSLVTNPELEDLAGNNLERLFDRDLTSTNESPDTPDYERTFTVAKQAASPAVLTARKEDP